MKKFFSLLTLALLTLSVGAATNTYSYTFGSKTFSADGTVTLNNVEWTLATVTEATDGGYFGYDGTKGQQFGSGSKPCSVWWFLYPGNNCCTGSDNSGAGSNRSCNNSSRNRS